MRCGCCNGINAHHNGLNMHNFLVNKHENIEKLNMISHLHPHKNPKNYKTINNIREYDEQYYKAKTCCDIEKLQRQRCIEKWKVHFFKEYDYYNNHNPGHYMSVESVICGPRFIEGYYNFI